MKVPIRIEGDKWTAKVPSGCVIRGMELQPNETTGILEWVLIYDDPEPPEVEEGE